MTPDPVTANEGGYAKFWAKFSANPPATVTWFINGHEIFTVSVIFKFESISNVVKMEL